MKSFLAVLFLLVSFRPSFSQDSLPDSTLPSKYFLNMRLSGNLTGAQKTGLGIRLGVGYKLSDNLSLMFSSGYMSSYRDPDEFEQQRIYNNASNSYFVTTAYTGLQKTEAIPVELSIRYTFDFMGVKPYIMYTLTKDYFFNGGSYDTRIETKNESTGQIVDSKSGKAYDLFDQRKDGFDDFGSKLSFGVLIPVGNKLNLDISYTYSGGGRTIHIISVGLNFDF